MKTTTNPKQTVLNLFQSPPKLPVLLWDKITNVLHLSGSALVIYPTPAGADLVF